jgi:hypothetical protein
MENNTVYKEKYENLVKRIDDIVAKEKKESSNTICLSALENNVKKQIAMSIICWLDENRAKGISRPSEEFCKEIDTSIKKRVHKLQDVQPYLLQFQSFTQELMMLMGNLMQWKFRLPSFMRSVLRSMTEKTVHDILTKNEWKDDNVRRSCATVRKMQQALGYSESWMTEFTQTVVMLAKKEKRPNVDDK